MFESRVRILVVEDNAGDAELVRERLLDADLSPDVIHAASLREAAELLLGPLPDAIVLDLNLPDSSGLETLERLRSLCPDVPTVVLTGIVEPQMRRAILAAGAADCLSKESYPFDVLLRSIRLSVALRRAVGQQLQMERLLKASPDAVIVADSAGVVRFVNDAALELFGNRREDFVGELLTFSVEYGTVVDMEIHSHGRLRTGQMRAVSVEWDGRSASMVTIRETTESRRLSEQLFQAQKMEAVGHLAGGVAHDFNNLITVILAYSAAIKDTLQAGDPRLEDVTQILAAAERATALTRQLLAFARRQPVQVQTVQLGALATGVRNLLGRIVPETIQLTITAVEDAWPVLADPGQVEQVLINLAVNACDAMSRGGKIEIAVDNVDDAPSSEGWKGGQAVRIRMTDTGDGIPPEFLPHIFEPFFTTKAPGKGTGLGLATCYGIVRQAGGTITVTSEVGRGTVFTILFPRTEVTENAPKGAKPTPPIDLSGHETIAVVEDDEPLRRSIVRMLRRYGYDVLTATNGVESRRIIEGHDRAVDVLVTDVVMPKMGGGELVDYIRLTRPSTKILCITGYALREDDSSTGLRDGVEVLYKPFEPLTLLQRIREMLRAENDAPREPIGGTPPYGQKVAPSEAL